MKKYIVVLKNNQAAAGITEGAATQDVSFLQPLYEQAVMEQAEGVDNTTDPGALAQLRNEMSRTYVIDLDNEAAVAQLDRLQQENLVERMEEDELNGTDFVRTDPQLPVLYGLKKMQVADTWKNGVKGEGIVVAVVDSGIDITHPDLQESLWAGPGGIHGFNVIDDSNDVTDMSGHGTHVAGTIAAIANNGIGIAGVAPGCKIMVIKGLDGPGGMGSASHLAKGIIKAVDNGARVINNSWGPGRSNEVRKAIDYAFLHNAVVVFAAGNSNVLVTPAEAAGNPHTISVGATDENDGKCTFSNFGPLVNVSAPGDKIFSTVPGNSYKTCSGTSMAAPHVSGLAALLLSANNKLAPGEVKNIITRTADAFPKPPASFIGSGRVNALKAVNAARGQHGEDVVLRGPEEQGMMILNFLEARNLITDAFVPQWVKLQTHLSIQGGTTDKPVLPAAHQNLAFEINRQQVIDKVLTPTTGSLKKIACILCFNDQSTPAPEDDSVSVMFAGVNAADRPVTDAVVEKWPGLYKLHELNLLLAEVLAPVTMPPGGMQQFTDAQATVTLFRDKWLELLADLNSVSNPRPGLRRNGHPMVFYMTAPEMNGLVNAPNCDSVVGVLGYYASGGLNYIAPFFVAVDSNKKPVSDIVFVGGSIAYTVNDSAFVLSNILTP